MAGRHNQREQWQRLAKNQFQVNTMLTNFKDLRGQTVYCQSGVCGRIFDIFFDDRNGMIRHIVLALGWWPRSRRVLLSPYQLNHMADGTLFVELRMDELRHLAEPDTRPPVSRQNFLRHANEGTVNQNETPLNEYRSSEVVETEAVLGDAGMKRSGVTVFDLLLRNRRREQSKEHLRSVKEVTGYEVEIESGRAGTVEDVWLSTNTWQVTHLSLALRAIKGRIAVPATLIRGISWSSGTVRLSAGWGSSENGPALVPTETKPDSLTPVPHYAGTTLPSVRAF